MLLHARQCVLPARRLAWRRLRRAGGSVGSSSFNHQRSPLSLPVTLTRASSSSSSPASASAAATHADADAAVSSSSPAPASPSEASPKLAKRKLALHIGYIGTAYRGEGEWGEESQRKKRIEWQLSFG